MDCIAVRVSCFQAHTCAQLHPAYSQQIMLHNAVQIVDSYFKLPQKAPPPTPPNHSPLSLPPFFLPHQSAGGEWSCVASLGRVSYLVLSPRLCLGTDLCVAVFTLDSVCTCSSMHAHSFAQPGFVFSAAESGV